MTSSHSTADIAALDQLTGGAFSAAHSSDRTALLRTWLEGQPALEQLQEVYREMSARDKGAAKVIKERLDEQKRLLRDPEIRGRLVRAANQGDYGRAIGAEARKPDWDRMWVFEDTVLPNPTVAAAAAKRGVDPVQALS